MTHPPSALFHASPEQRLAYARERYFEEGTPPTGVVTDAVAQSWGRCRRKRPDPKEAVVFDLVTHSRAQLAIQRNRPLLSAWASELHPLEFALAGSSCAAMLTDATGVLVAAACSGRAHEQIMPVATRIGVNLSEESVGTTAPGVVIKTGKPVCVLGAEHYFEGVAPMQCAAAPIHNTRGELAGVLDISSERLLFDFDAASFVGMYAAAIENRLLIGEASGHLVVQMQMSAPLIDTPMVGLLGLDGDGCVAWANPVALRLLGGRARSDGPIAAEQVLGVGLASLLALPQERAMPMRLASGLTLWARCIPPASDGLRRPFGITAVTASADPSATPSALAPADPPADPEDRACVAQEESPGSKAEASEGGVGEAASLRALNDTLVMRTIQSCGGNVSAAARRLGVSRGLIYRRIRQLAPGADDAAQAGAPAERCAETRQLADQGKPEIDPSRACS